MKDLIHINLFLIYNIESVINKFQYLNYINIFQLQLYNSFKWRFEANLAFWYYWKFLITNATSKGSISKTTYLRWSSSVTILNLATRLLIQEIRQKEWISNFCHLKIITFCLFIMCRYFTFNLCLSVDIISLIIRIWRLYMNIYEHV